MTVKYSNKFLKQVRKLPAIQQEKLAKLLEYMREDPFHSKLHTKFLTGRLAGFLSFRVTRDWRVVFQFIDADTVQLLQVAHRKDIYK